MKYLLIFLFVCGYSAVAQDTITLQDPLQPNTIIITPTKKSKSSSNAPVVFNEKYETLYRGVNNRLSFIIPEGVTSCTFTAPGLVRSGHNYVDINVPKGYTQNWLKLECRVVTKKETHTYTYIYIVKNIETRMLINGQGCEKCIVQQTLKELQHAQISIVSADVRPYNTVGVVSFTVTLPNGSIIQVDGNRMSDEAHFLIEQYTKPGDIVTVDKIRCRVPACECNLSTYPVKIMLVE